jgi:outer membrane receptor protein involved in Fe transport
MTLRHQAIRASNILILNVLMKIYRLATVLLPRFNLSGLETAALVIKVLGGESMKWTRFFFSFSLIFCFSLVTIPAWSQSTTAGDIAGTVTDPTGAVVPNAKVTATNDSTGAAHNTTTNGEGFYRFSFLQPGAYSVAVSATGFQSTNRKVQVAVGQASSGSIALSLTAASTTVEVTTTPLQLENGDNSTGFNTQQISLVPNPGNDLSAVAQTSPGTIQNTQGGFGNFSTYGLPGTSNLFTLDGQNDNDPFLNLNNSGATNLLLGANDVQEATVTTNGYSGQYGQLAGSQINYLTKSGGNQWHGNAVYYWNGRVLNANNYRNNLAIQGSPSTPRPFDNANQWAASFGGPIQKDKTFFFFNYEGLRVVIPISGQIRVPDPVFEANTLASLAVSSPASVPFYQKIFALYNAAPGAAHGTPAACINFSGAGPCALLAQTTATNFTREYQLSLRLDHKFSEKDSIFGRVQTDRGVQATSTDRINPLFNTQSNQPEYQGQISETHIFNSNAVNEFKTSTLWYSAIFDSANPAATKAAFPTTLQFVGGDFSTLGGIGFLFPQGRNVTQYQFVDDFSYNRGKHTWRFGANFRRYDVSNHDYGVFTNGLAVATVDAFATGQVGFFQRNFPTRLSQPIALYGLGIYGQDEWRVTNKLKLTLALRVDHNSNPICRTNCFARLIAPFTSLTHDDNIPYNQVIKTGLSQAYPSTDGVVWQPRLGFAYSPFGSNRTVIRGGLGIFGDAFPAVLVDNFSSNPPVLNSFITSGFLSPVAAGNVFGNTAAANTAFSNAFASGATFKSLLQTVPGFSAPAITTSDSKIRQPRYQEWNLEVQQNLGWDTVLSMNYVGNHGIYEGVLNNGLNGFADSGNFPSGFAGLPAGRVVTVHDVNNINGGMDISATVGPDARFGTVTQVQSIAVSNYNGLVTSVRHDFKHGFIFRVNYTYSHAFDEVSNGGLLPFNNTTNVSILSPLNPFNLRSNYGSSDYDIRHYFSSNYVWDDSLRHLFHWGPNKIFSGWTVSGTIFARSGVPFSVIDGGTGASLNGDNFGGKVLANITGSTGNGSCGRPSATPDPTTGTLAPCLNFAGFASPTGLNSNQRRNSFRGPNYFNTDLSILKHTKLTEKTSLAIGFQFFNLFNHPNFDQPIGDIASGDATLLDPTKRGTFGTTNTTLNTPTSILGSFLGGDASPRLIQLKMEFKF